MEDDTYTDDDTYTEEDALPMTRRWGVNPQQAKTTHTREDKGFFDEYYWDKKHRVLFRWWPGRGWIRTSVPVSEVSRVIEPGEGYENERKTKRINEYAEHDDTF